MSSAVVSTSAALGRPFAFDEEEVADVSLPFAPAIVHPAIRPLQTGRHAALSGDPASVDPRLASVTPASRLEIRPAPEMVSCGVSAIDALTGGLPRGCLTEICGLASSGRTSLLLATLAAATRRGEFCVVVDASDSLDPHSVATAGVELDRFLWVRCGDDSPAKARSKQKRCPISRASLAREACPELVEGVRLSFQPAFNSDRTSLRTSEHRLEQVLRATDLLLESGGFGLIVLDLGDLPPQLARYIPLTTWFRFRRAIENTPTILLAIEQQPIAGSCSTLLLQLGSSSDPTTPALAAEWRKSAAHGASRGSAVENEEAPEGQKKICLTAAQSAIDFEFAEPTHTKLLTKLEITAELIRSRLERKPARSTASFATKTAWAGEQ
ncbi:MAG: hypothetical protein ACXWSZ_22780 [Bdellovibrionota bacterium]